MKKARWILSFLAFAFAGTLFAAPITGSLDSGTGGGLFATGPWAGGDAELNWSVTQLQNGNWRYTYTFAVEEKDISHMLIEISPTFTSANVKSGTTSGWQLGTWGTQGNSNPGIPSSLYGLKFGGDSETEVFTIVTDRAPMWGDFYAKDGRSGGYDVYAYNTAFGGSTTASIYDRVAGMVLVPDTFTNVPEPAILPLFGAGMLLLGGIPMLRDRKRTA